MSLFEGKGLADFGLSGLSLEQMSEARKAATVWHVFEWIGDLAMYQRLESAQLGLRLRWAMLWGVHVLHRMPPEGMALVFPRPGP